MPTSPIVQLQLAFAVCAVLFALWKGGVAERLAALVVAANLVVGMAPTGSEPASSDMLGFVNDGLSAFALLAITLRYGAPWMGVVMLFYASQFALHAAYMVVGRDETDYLHAVINNLNFTGVTVCLVVAAAAAWRRRIKARTSAARSSSPMRRQ